MIVGMRIVGMAILIGVFGWGAGVVCAQEVYRLERGGWTRQNAFEAGSAAGELQAVRKAIAEEDYKEAAKLATRWIKRRPNHPLEIEAYLLRGDAMFARGLYFKALFDYEYIVRSYPGSEQFNEALEREYEIAVLFTGIANNGKKVRRKTGWLRLLLADGEGEELFIRIQERSPGSELGERASLALGDYYFQQAEMNQAADAYDLFLTNYPNSRHRERAFLRLIQSNLATYKGPRFDQTGLIEARQLLRAFERDFPASAERIGATALRVRIRESLARKSFEIGRWYERRKEDVSARYMFRRVVDDFPQTAASRAALERLEALGDEVVRGVGEAGVSG